MKKIILVTGGERSGKSRYAEQLVLGLSREPVYVATARIWDEEFRRRVELHRQHRGPQWTNIEEEKHLSRHDLTGRTVLVDCLTLWATNFFFDLRPAPDPAATEAQQADAAERQAADTLRCVKEEFVRFTGRSSGVFVFVTNEIGLGGIPADPVQRRFTDILGELNRFVAECADEVYLMVCGIPVKIK